ncbi:hypothetical protein [Plasmodium yoelii yoelii]|uniref:Uncharacterized protein n=1 Tax=Plasmodium yoelii yoelii TaxID=73239 RepID=Q7RAS8_PLAYO|nr:hypothetical protein [Plasmodium yoelii yoelii]
MLALLFCVFRSSI